MDINVQVRGQKLRIPTNLKGYAPGSQNFIKFVFDLSEDWDGLSVFAQFSQDGNGYNQYLDEDGAAYLPHEITTGQCILMLYGTGGSGDNTVIATTNYIVLTLDRDLFITDAESTDISESLYTQLVNKVNDMEASIPAEIDAAVPQYVTAWLDENITQPTDPAIDTSLSVSGAAADAKATGDAVDELNSQIGDLDDLTTINKSNLVSAINEAVQTGGGSPKGVTLAGQMTDTDENYLYLGNESGYEYGYVYVYLGGEWTKTTLYGKGQDGAPGTNGEDGFSPVVTVEQIPSGVEISVTDKEGTTTATVENGTATDAQVNAWLDEHPEATTTVQDNSITPNKTTFVAEPYTYNTIEVPLIRGSINESTGAITESSSASTGITGKVPIDLTKGTSVKFAVTGSKTIRNRWVWVWNGDTCLGHVDFASTVDRGTVSLAAYLVDGVPTADAIAFQVNSYVDTAYISNDPSIPNNYLSTLTKTYFDFREGYKDAFYHALGLDDGGITTDSIADGAVTGVKFGDGSVEPRKLSENTNMLDFSEIITRKYLGNPGINSGDGCIFWIPVEPGETYTVNFVPANFYFYGFWQSDKTTHVGQTNYSVSAQSEPYDIVVPNNSNIAYMVISTTQIWSIYSYGVLPRWKLWKKSYGEPELEYSFDWLKLNDANKLRSSLFRRKKVLATGDSITENNTRNDNKSWCMYLPEKLGVTIYNDGKSGTGLAKSYSGNHSILYRVENEWDTTYSGITPDIVLIMGNMNDGTGTGTSGTNSLNDLGISGWASTGYLAVGTPADGIDTQSVYGCAKRFLEDVITKYPDAKIGWILSTPRKGTVSYWTGKENDFGHGWFEDYITAIKYQCEEYNVPVLDLYHESQFRPTNTTNMNTYMDDGTTHPNTAGIKKYMVDPIVKWIENVFGDVS